MKREQAEKHFAARAAMLVHRVRALPPAEQLRLAADFVDRGMPKHALAIVRYVAATLGEGST